MINWASTKEEMEIISRIAKRASALAAKLGFEYSVRRADMDISATHLNGCPLRLRGLLAADDANFAHDAFGIRRFIDRNTGQMPDSFWPRYAQ